MVLWGHQERKVHPSKRDKERHDREGDNSAEL